MKYMTTLLTFVLLFAGSAACSVSKAAPTPSVGTLAPDVSGVNQDGKPWSLAAARGHGAVLLFFYPKDDTPGCTREACGFRDDMSSLSALGVTVVGVSFDSPESHREFIEKHNLNFDLVADTEGKIADAFGVRAANGRVARRVSFLIDRGGMVRHVTDSSNPAQHLEEMKAAARNLPR